jgi:hypothetical protein
MLPRDRILRTARIHLRLGVLLAVGVACSSRAATTAVAPLPAATSPAATGLMVPYTEFADLQYFQLKGTNTVVIEFFDGSGTVVVDVQCEMQKSGPEPLLQVRILGNKNGPESKKFVWDTEGNAVYYFDVGVVDKSKLRVVYNDDKGQHDIPAAGIVDKPFEAEHAASAKPDVTGKQ